MTANQRIYKYHSSYPSSLRSTASSSQEHRKQPLEETHKEYSYVNPKPHCVPNVILEYPKERHYAKSQPSNWSFSLYNQGKLSGDELAKFVERSKEAEGVTQFKARESVPPHFKMVTSLTNGMLLSLYNCPLIRAS